MTSQELPKPQCSQQAPEQDNSGSSSAEAAPPTPPPRVEPKDVSTLGTGQSASPPQVPQEKPPSQRLQALQKKKLTLEAKLADLQTHRAALVNTAKMPSGLDMPDTWSEEQKSQHALATANATIKEHIALLHRYNEIKDVGMGLMGLVAERRQMRVQEVMEEFGVAKGD